MAKADAFKQQIERDNPVGTPLPIVVDYVRARGFDAGDFREFTHNGLITYSGAVYVLMFTNKSPRWDCGREAVGVILDFKDTKFRGVTTEAWHGPKGCWD
jgi:hypothetical protein